TKLHGCDGLPKTVRVFQFTLDSRSEKLDWLSTSPRVSSYLVKAYQIYLCCCKDWKLLFFDVATSIDSAVHRVHAVSFDAAVLDGASTVSAACIVAAGYIVSAGICDAAGLFVLAVFIYICCLLCFCCYSILLLREDLSRNLELTESKPIQEPFLLIMFLLVMFSFLLTDIESADLIYRRDYFHAVSFDAAVLDVASTVSAACIVAAGYIVSAGICDAAGSSSSVSAGYIIEFMLEDLEAVPADYVPAGHVLISADRYRIC
ncbi:hypothetical protein Tco_1305173, partial [Tanacetum coccineum]